MDGDLIGNPHNMEAPVIEALTSAEKAVISEVCGTIVEAPVVEDHITEAPVVEAPITEAPVVEAPIIEALAVQAHIIQTTVHKANLTDQHLHSVCEHHSHDRSFLVQC